MLSLFPAKMLPGRRSERRLTRRSVSTRAFTCLETGVHQARFKCLIFLAVFTLFWRLLLTDAAITRVGYAFTPTGRI